VVVEDARRSWIRDEANESREAFAGLFIPFLLGLLHEEGVGTAPIGCFDRIINWSETSGLPSHEQALQ
jgi:hypothetical protein